MKKLKIILQSKDIYLILLLFSFFYAIMYISFINLNSNYNGNEKVLYGKIVSKNINGDKLTLIIKNKEKVLINYYFKTKKEKNEFNMSYGDYIKAYGKLEKIANNTNFNTFNYRKYLYSKRIFFIFKTDKIVKLKDNNNPFNSIKEKIELRTKNCFNTKEYIKAFIIGDKKDVDIDYITMYQELGVSHLFAISGMHVSLITMILLKMLSKIKYKYFIVDIFLIFYIFLTGFMPSVIRACLVFILYSINKLFKLHIKSLYILLFLLSILLLYNPLYIYDIGFIFSFLISISLIFYKYKIDMKNNYFHKTIYISFLSFIISLPIVINNFYQINFLSIFLNLIYVPYISFIVFPMGLLTYIFPFLDSIYMYFIEFLEFITKLFYDLKIVVYFAKLPYIFYAFYYLFIIFYIKRVTKMKTLFLIFILIAFYNFNRVVEPRVTFIDVGQGDSSLIRIKSKNILIDTGGKVSFNTEKWREKNTNNSITKNTHFPFLKSIGVKKINYLILTHGDYDHMGEAINLVNNFKVEKVIFNCGPFNDLEKELIKVLDKKKIKYYSCIKELNIDKKKLYFLQTKKYDNENDNSNVIYAELDGYKFMFMGDASTATEKEIINTYNLPDIDVLKVGHHGSKTSSSKEFIDEINPKYSIISVGKNNRYGHPNKEVLDNLKDSKIYRTDQNGSIMFKIKNNKLKIETCSP